MMSNGKAGAGAGAGAGVDTVIKTTQRQRLISDAPCGRRSRSKTGAIGAYKFGALDGGMTEGQIQMLGAAFG